MKNQKTFQILVGALFLFVLAALCPAQTTILLKRTTYKTENIEFGAGGTISVTGAPQGSIEIEGWNKNEIEVSAEIEMQAETENDLAQLATVSGFLIDESPTHVRIVSLGTHNKEYMKKTAKKFPKQLFGKPLRIDYKIKVPRYASLVVNGGNGDFRLSNVDGEIRINYLDTNARLSLIGGSIQATFGSGTVDVEIPTRSWRGRFADIQLASGTLNVRLPLNLNAQLDAAILRTGQIENSFTNLKPRTRNIKFTDKSIAGQAGVGGVALNFAVGDGTLNISELGPPQ